MSLVLIICKTIHINSVYVIFYSIGHLSDSLQFCYANISYPYGPLCSFCYISCWVLFQDFQISCYSVVTRTDDEAEFLKKVKRDLPSRCLIGIIPRHPRPVRYSFPPTPLFLYFLLETLPH